MNIDLINDLSSAAAFGLLIATAAAAIGYLIGKSHGHEAGELAGSNAERQESTARVLKAKRDGFHSGRIAGFVQAIDLMFPNPHQPQRNRGGPMTPRPGKPGINNSAAPATQGAQNFKPN